jgi:hypothetical protein
MLSRRRISMVGNSRGMGVWGTDMEGKEHMGVVGMVVGIRG